jgi:hypothetical protein
VGDQRSDLAAEQASSRPLALAGDILLAADHRAVEGAGRRFVPRPGPSSSGGG